MPDDADKILALDSDAPCWRTIGVWADCSPICPKLAEVVHCANCEIFREKGRALFEMEPSPDYLRDWGTLIAKPAKDEGARESILVFRLDDEWLAFSTGAFKGVADIAPIHSLPHKSDALLLGLSNIGGSLQICFSLKALLGLDQLASKGLAASDSPTTKARFLILERAGRTWVFQADEILGVVSFDPQKLQNMPSTVSRANPSFVRLLLEYEGRAVGLLDDELVVFALKRSLQ